MFTISSASIMLQATVCSIVPKLCILLLPNSIIIDPDNKFQPILSADLISVEQLSLLTSIGNSVQAQSVPFIESSRCGQCRWNFAPLAHLEKQAWKPSCRSRNSQQQRSSRLIAKANDSMADDSLSSEMSLENALKLLGVREGASFEEIFAAKKIMVENWSGDQAHITQVEAAYDMLLMQSLSLRQAGKATLIIVAGLFAGAGFGGLVESGLCVDIVPVLGIGSPAVVVSEFVLFSLWASSLYLH